MSDLYCNNGCPYERIGKCPENGMPERCGIQAMYAELATVKAERDAAVEDMRHIDNCDVCIGGGITPDDCEADCLNCKLDCRCKDCRDENKFEWRGVQDGKEREG